TLLGSKLATMLVTRQFAGFAEAKESRPDPADEPAYQFEAVYTAEVWRNVRGGISTGSAYLDNVDLTLAIDAERAWGWSGVSAFVYGLHARRRPRARSDWRERPFHLPRDVAGGACGSVAGASMALAVRP